MKPSFAVVVCDYLRREVEAAVAAEALDDVRVVVRRPRCGLAMAPTGLDLGLGDSRTLLLGGACCRDLPDNPSSGTLRLPDASGCCAQLFLPAATVHDLARSGAYLTTPGWLSDWRRHLSEWGFDQATARAFFSESCDRLVLLDTGVEPAAGGHLAEWAHYVDRPCETLEVGLDLLRASLSRAVLAWRAETAATRRADAGAMADALSPAHRVR